MALTVRTDRSLVRTTGRSVRHVLATITAPDVSSRASRAPVNVGLVLDRSGSMSGEKISLARRAVQNALQLLRPEDRFALVVFDDKVDVVTPSTPGHGEARRRALRELSRIDARGSTWLAGGWEAGCRQVIEHLEPERLGRCLLVTDGLANVGESDPERLAELAAAMRRRGVTTSTFGIGADFDERTLQRIAERGQGHFYFVERPEAIPDLLTSELGDTLEIVAREAALVLHLPEGVAAAPVVPLPVSSAGQVVRFELGDLVSGAEREVAVRLTFPAGTAGEAVGVRFALTARDEVFAGVEQELTWTFAGQAENDAQVRDREVDRAVARFYADMARQAALALNRDGRFEDARRLLERVARKIRSCAGTDPELRRLVEELTGEGVEYGAPMEALRLKQRHFAAYAGTYSRTAEGKTRRR